MLKALCRTGIVAAGMGVGLILFTFPASAHVTVNSQDAQQGGFAVVNFRVPNESETASTTKLRIQLPQDHPITSVRVEPMPGWNYRIETRTLPEPNQDDHGDTNEAASVIEWTTVSPEDGIGPNEFQEFPVSLGRLPEVDQLTFGAVQTYSDGTEVAWIDQVAEGQPEPRHPAPVLTLASAQDNDSNLAAAPGAEEDDGASKGAVTTAIVLASLGLAAGLGGLILGVSSRRLGPRSTAETKDKS